MTARDIKGQVEGYQEMSDEAFARRFYSDRAELIALGRPAPLAARRVHRRGALQLRSERYFLPPLELTDDELAALQTCLYLLEGKFAYAEPLRLALQNLALGRAGLRRGADRHGAAGRGARPRVLGRDAGPARQARGGDLEAADGQVPVLVDLARRGARADGQPVRALRRTAAPGTSSATTSTPRPSARSASRASAARSASPPAASATSGCRPSSTSTATAAGRRGRSATPPARRAIEVAGDTAWWVERTFGTARSRTASS